MARWTYKVSLRLRSLLRKGKAEEELDDELRFHLENLTEEHIADGMSPNDARCMALRELGGVEQHKEECRDMRGIRWLDELRQDLRYGVRTLVKSRGFTLIALLLLALGVSSTTTVYSVVQAVLLRALPFPHPERLVRVNEKILWDGKLINHWGVGVSNLLAWRENNPVLLDLAQYNFQSFKILGAGEPAFLNGAAVTVNLFELLQVRPLLGRAFSPDEDEPGSPPVVILSHSLWKSRFAGREDVVGETIRLDDTSYTVIGITRPDFEFPSGDWRVPSLFVPLQLKAQPRSRAFLTIARLRPGISIERAQAVMSSLAKDGGRSSGATQGVQLQSLRELTVANVRTTMLVLLGAAGLVLFIACANVASLLLTRVTQRQKEFAVRAALGAGSRRLVRQLLVECMLLSLIGGSLGILLSVFGVEVLKDLRPPEIPQLEKISLNIEVLGFALGLSLTTGLFFGIMPIRRVLKLGIQDTLKGHSQRLPGRTKLRSLNLLIISEISLALLLLIGAGLLMNSFLRLQNVPLGFERDKLLTVALSLPPPRYTSAPQWEGFYLRLLADLQALPGVEAAALTSSLPLRDDESLAGLTFDEKPPGLSEADNTIPGFGAPPGAFAALLVRVTPAYFRTLGFRLVKGRFQDERDSSSSLPCLVISETMARHLWPDESPVGKRAWLANRSCEIVGVIEDIRYNDLRSDFLPVVYLPFRLQPVPDMKLVLRTRTDPTGLASAVRNRVRALDETLPVVLKTMEQEYARELAAPRFYMLVFGLFGVLATAIAAGGVYGVISFSVSQRTQEIGVRMALGAQSHDILGLVLGLGMTPAAVGIALGLAGAAGLTRFISSLLFGVPPTDPAIFAGLAALMAAVALAACYIPSRRATRIDPIQVIRCE
jgi:putative ABC transport system permease protein